MAPAAANLVFHQSLETDDDEDDGTGIDGLDTSGYPLAGVQEFSGPEELSASQLKWQKKLRKKVKSGGFESLGLSLPIYRAVKKQGYRVPTPIQRKTLPLVMAGYDVVAMARTGSGKTAAFLIPMLERLKEHSIKAGARAVILSPTRELALQTFKFCKELGRYTDLRSAVLVGGDSMEGQFEELSKNPDILVATPGRLMHHLSEVEGMSLRTVQYIVFDEADRLFEMGFAEQLRQIMSKLSETRQTLLFSATLPGLLADFAKAGLQDPHLVRLDTEKKISSDLKLAFFTLRNDEKLAALLYLVRELLPADQQTIIFVATKHHVEFIFELLKSEGVDLSVVYGDMDQTARKIHIAKFRARKTMLLLVTDVAARGIDIPLLDNVINFDFPPKPKLFVHRVGRAARAGRIGTAFSFLTADEMPFLLDLHLFLSKPIRPAPTEEEVQANWGQVLRSVEEALSRGETVYGRFAQSVLDFNADRLRAVVHQSTELTALQKACSNAFRLYCKTRPAASLESGKRAKELANEGLHPMLRDKVGTVEASVSAFAERVRAFRPKQTVLEAEGEAAKGKKKQVPIAFVGEVMKRKRAMHEHVIEAAHQQKSSHKPSELWSGDFEEKTLSNLNVLEGQMTKKAKLGHGLKQQPKSYRDEEFYIDSIPSNRHTEMGLAVSSGENFGSSRMDTEVLDLVADDAAGAQKQRATYHWDKKHKKYVKLHRGEQVTASGKIKSESGSKINAGNRGIYKKWKERSHLQVSTMGDEEEGNALSSRGTESGLSRGMRKAGGAGKPRSVVPNAHVRDELRGVEEVRKQRQKSSLKGNQRGGKTARGRGGKRGQGHSGKSEHSRGKTGVGRGGKSGAPRGRNTRGAGPSGKARGAFKSKNGCRERK